MKPSLGIDPGTPGAAVLLDATGACQMAAYWKEARKGAALRLCWWSRTHGVGRHTLANRYSAVGDLLLELFVQEAAGHHTLLRAEGVFVSPRNPSSGLKLARAVGALVAPLQEHLDQTADHVMATSWRSALLGLRARTPSKTCKEQSLRGMPLRVPGLSEALEHLGRYDHITDAAGVAQSGQVTR